MKWALILQLFKKIIPLIKKGIYIGKKIFTSPSAPTSKKKKKKSIDRVGCTKGADHESYVVGEGEALKDIARVFGCPNERNIMACNNIQDPNAISVGQMLQIPFYYYTVKKGDTVHSIALAHQISEWDLWAIRNNLTGPDYKIQEGQKLKIWI